MKLEEFLAGPAGGLTDGNRIGLNLGSESASGGI